LLLVEISTVQGNYLFQGNQTSRLTIKFSSGDQASKFFKAIKPSRILQHDVVIMFIKVLISRCSRLQGSFNMIKSSRVFQGVQALNCFSDDTVQGCEACKLARFKFACKIVGLASLQGISKLALLNLTTENCVSNIQDLARLVQACTHIEDPCFDRLQDVWLP